jgi:hypothetical protein
VREVRGSSGRDRERLKKISFIISIGSLSYFYFYFCVLWMNDVVFREFGVIFY